MSVTWFDDANVTLTVEAAFDAGASGAGVWDIGVWDIATWGTGVSWVDISGYARSIKTRIGRSREYEHFTAGTATLVVGNSDGRFSPQNLDGPYVTAGLTGVRPWRPVRVYMSQTYDTTPSADVADGRTYGSIFYGYIEKITEQFPGTKDATVTFELVDGIARIAAFNGYAQSAAGSGETTGRRIHRWADLCGWDGGRNIDQSGTLCESTTLASNAWTGMLLTADSDGGEIWVDPDNSLVFQANGALFGNPASNTIQATFADDGSGFPYSDIAFDYSGDQLINIAALARVGSTEQIAADLDSRALYFDHQFSRDDLICNSDSQVLALANQLVFLRSDPEEYISQIVFYPQRDPSNLWPEIYYRRMRDRIHITHTHPGSSTETSDRLLESGADRLLESGDVRLLESDGVITIDQDCFVGGIEHDIRPGFWKVLYHTDSATKYPSAAQFGMWDSGVWDSSAWGF